MTVEEIYGEIGAHMIKGMMLHEQLANYYDFLGLKGYKRCHEYHYLQETCAYRGVCRYFINHHSKLIPYKEVEDPKIIPSNWYNYSRQDVDASTKRNGVRTGLTSWVNWERETKILYEQMYKELINIDEVASAMKIKELLCDVDHELKMAERYWLDKEAVGYDMSVIIEEQSRKHDKYARKMRKLGVDIC